MNTDELINRINELQSIHCKRGMTKVERYEWDMIMMKLRMGGFRVGRKRTTFGFLWSLKQQRNSNMLCEMVFKDLSPNHKHLKGNCTTRAMTYCIPEMTYDEIEAEQYSIADSKNNCSCCRYHRNSRGIWEIVMQKRGWKKIKLIGTIRRDKITNMLRDTKFPVITVSSHHASVAHNGNCVDSWDCRKGRVEEIVVHDEDLEKVKRRFAYSLVA